MEQDMAPIPVEVTKNHSLVFYLAIISAMTMAELSS